MWRRDQAVLLTAVLLIWRFLAMATVYDSARYTSTVPDGPRSPRS